MGLDIIAYRGLQSAVASESDCKYCEYFRGELEYTEKRFPGRTSGLDPRLCFCCDDSFSFRAGSYSGYNEWRDRLAEMAGFGSAEEVWKNQRSGPFVELINFSDCEGLIGPEVSAKLAKDFADYEERAVAFDAGDHFGDYFIALYREWRRAFEWAADNGMVQFC